MVFQQKILHALYVMENDGRGNRFWQSHIV